MEEMWVTIKEKELIEKDKEIKELKTRVSELQDKDWYEACIRQLEDQNNKLIKERDELKFEKRNVFGLIEKMEVKVAGVTKEKILAIRRQLCNEIRTFINEYDACENKQLFVMNLLTKLDQIARGEE